MEMLCAVKGCTNPRRYKIHCADHYRELHEAAKTIVTNANKPMTDNRCKRCCMPTTRPDTAFVDGICSACLTHDAQKAIDWSARKQDLLALFDRQQPNDTGYDCVVGSSGGKDSTAQVLALQALGFRPLVVTATTCMLSPLGRRNIDNLAHYATTIEVSPNKDVRKKLNRLGLSLVGDISWPEHVSIFTTPVRMAAAFGIPLVFYGENPQAQYGGPIGADEARVMTRRWVSEFGGFLGLRPSDLAGVDGITAEDMRDYLMPTDEALQRSGVEAHFLGQYLGPWDSRKNADVAGTAGMEWEDRRGQWWPFENVDNLQTPIHDFFCWLKYGYSRTCAQVSVDIRNKLITREEGLEIVKMFDGLFLESNFNLVLESLEISQEAFIDICNRFMNHDLFIEDRIEWGQQLTLRGE